MKALSLLQPWASLVACGAKRFETRSFKVPKTISMPEVVAIHASMRYPLELRALANTEPFHSELPAGTLPRGALLAVVLLQGCERTEDVLTSPLWREYAAAHEESFGNYKPQRYAWLMTDAFMLPEPIPYKGALNLFVLDPGTLWKIRKMLIGHPLEAWIPGTISH